MGRERAARDGCRKTSGCGWILAGALAGVCLVAPVPGTAQPTPPQPDAEPHHDPAQDPPAPFDPLRGIEPDGRIPRVEIPDDIERPDRWRYIPEGRLKPGNVFQRLFVSSFMVPIVFRETDVGTGGGLAITDIDFRGQRRQEFAGIFLTYTSEGQQNYSMVWRRWLHHRELPDGGVLQEERSFVRGRAGYSRTLTRRFFGFGAGSDEDDESSYSDELAEIEIGLERALPGPGGDWVASVGVRGELHRLGSGSVEHHPDTRDAFPRTFRAARDSDLGWAETSLRWDTRDSQALPYRGSMLAAWTSLAPVQRGGDVGLLYGVEGQHLFPLPGLLHAGGDPDEEHPPTDSLALGVRLTGSAGNLPFFSLPTLGGAYGQRGYIAGRFRDGASWLGIVEYRFWVLPRGVPITRTIRIERVGLAPFYEIGSVAGDIPRLFESKVLHSYGIGLRVTLERTAPFRVDVGFSEEGAEVNARFGLSF